MRNLNILVVDDNVLFSSTVEKALHSQGYTHIRTASNPFQALDAIKAERPDLILLDLYLPGMDGLHLMSAIHKIDKTIPVMILSSEADQECINVAESLGAVKYLVKPFQLGSLFEAISQQCASR